MDEQTPQMNVPTDTPLQSPPQEETEMRQPIMASPSQPSQDDSTEVKSPRRWIAFAALLGIVIVGLIGSQAWLFYQTSLQAVPEEIVANEFDNFKAQVMREVDANITERLDAQKDELVELINEKLESAQPISGGSHLFLRTNENTPNDQNLVLKTSSENEEVLATLQMPTNSHSTSVALDGGIVYFRNQAGGVSTMNLATKQFASLPIPTTDPDTPIAVIHVEDGMMYYFQGRCGGVGDPEGECRLYSYNIASNNEVFLGSIEGQNALHQVSVENIDDNKMTITSLFGDAGLSAITVYEYDLLAGTSEKIGSESRLSCGDEFDQEPCTEEMIARNQAFVDFSRQYSVSSQTSGLCNDVELSTESDIFLGCM